MCQKHKCITLASRVLLRRQEGPPEFWSIGYEIFEFAVESVYSVFADLGVMMFQAGAIDRDQQFEEFGILGGNRRLRRRYIHLDVAGDNHHKIRG